MEQNKNFKYFLLLGLKTIILGLLIGVLVGTYQIVGQLVTKASLFLYGSKETYIIALNVIMVIILSIANFYILKIAPSVDGSGIPTLELALRNKKKMHDAIDIIAMIINSYISNISGFTLGSEGPSVVISSKLAHLYNKIVKDEDDLDTVKLAGGIGFGCAFLSPISGLAYAYEENLKKINIKVLVQGVTMMVLAFLMTSLINHHHLLEISSYSIPKINDIYIYPLLIIINLIGAFLFVHLVKILKSFFFKHKDNVFVKYRGFFMFLIVLILNYTVLSIMGAGGILMKNLVSYSSLVILFSILFARFILTIISGCGKVTGGLIVPILTIGAINGKIISLICVTYLGLSLSYEPLIILMSAVMFFALIIHTPFTALALFYSAVRFLTNNYLDAFYVFPYLTIAIFISYFIFIYLLKCPSLYEEQIDLAIKYSQNKKQVVTNN